jgi:hypothetical protein
MMRRHWRGFRGSGFGPSMLALGAISALSILVTTRHGVGIDADSVAYVDLARHLRSGAGFALSPGLTPIADPQMLRPTAHFPPLYPVLLALGETIGLDVWTFARWLGATLAGTTAVLIGAVIKDAKASPGRTLLVVWLTITAVDWLHVHAWALSEGASPCADPVARRGAGGRGLHSCAIARSRDRCSRVRPAGARAGDSGRFVFRDAAGAPPPATGIPRRPRSRE